MGCQPWRDAISALADGEEAEIEPRLLDAHLRQCPACARYESEVQASRRSVRVGLAPVPPDLAAPVARAVALEDRRSRWFVLRVLLALTAGQIVGMALPELLATSGGAPHGDRHLGAFSLAYAVGLFAVVVRPARARTVLSVGWVLAATLVLSAVVDVAQSRTGVLDESVHAAELVSVALLWMLAHAPLRRPPGVPATGDVKLRLAREPGQPPASGTGSSA